MYISHPFPISIAEGNSMLLPMGGFVQAGFPSAALDFDCTPIDINTLLIKHPATTFFCNVKGDSMRDAGIHDGDLLIIDRSIRPQDGKIAVCYIDGEFTVKRLKVERDCVYLMPENANYKPIKVTEDNELIVWGIVTNVIKSF